MIFLLQEVLGALDTAPVGTNSMISGQGALCLSHCKVKLMQTSSLPATLQIHYLACMSSPSQHSLQAMPPYVATVGATIINHLLLYIGIECSNRFVCLSDQPSRAKQGACSANAAHVHQAVFAQSSHLLWRHPLTKAAAMEHSGPPAHQNRCQVSFC